MADDSELRDMYLRQRGWTPHFADKGKWWLADPLKAKAAEDAAAFQVEVDEGCLVYMLERLSPHVKALLRAHVMMACLQEIQAFAQDPEEQAKLKGRATEWLSAPETQQMLRGVVKALREIAGEE